MHKIDQELIARMTELKDFCELNGYPLSDFLEEEIEYYKVELTRQYNFYSNNTK
jgi:hypothetical protein